MVKEIVDGSTIYSGLFTDAIGQTWNILIRQGGSISLYATAPGVFGHGVAFDTLDGKPPSPYAQQIINQLAERAEGINALLIALKSGVVGDLIAALDEVGDFLCYITEEDLDARNDRAFLVQMGDKVRAALDKARGSQAQEVAK